MLTGSIHWLRYNYRHDEWIIGLNGDQVNKVVIQKNVQTNHAFVEPGRVHSVQQVSQQMDLGRFGTHFDRARA